MKSSAEIRQDFLDFFASKGHTIVPSSPLVPGNDPTLLFTNAGMVQFKDVFLGAEKRSYTRAASSQRCVRAGGKHNDLDQVGYTARHHTFFEMLGNFSFGDYFKTRCHRLRVGAADRRLAAAEGQVCWSRSTTPTTKPSTSGTRRSACRPSASSASATTRARRYASDNFWQMADTGPCGPCTEIFYDHGAHIAGGPPGSPDEDGDRFIEIWNNVFMQFDRQPDGTPAAAAGALRRYRHGPGAPRRRAAARAQQLRDRPVPAPDQGTPPQLTGTADLDNKSLRVIADHIRACSFLIVDGVLPSNEGRGYVLRRIIRRAIRHFWKLGALQADGQFWRMVQPLVEMMGDAYPELVAKRALIEQALRGRGSAHSRRPSMPA